jgi:hypothetical protein
MRFLCAGPLLYNHSRPWISHVSLQGHIDDTAGLKNAILAPFLYKNDHFYQDRLGTNIGKALKKEWRFQACGCCTRSR